MDAQLKRKRSHLRCSPGWYIFKKDLQKCVVHFFIGTVAFFAFPLPLTHEPFNLKCTASLEQHFRFGWFYVFLRMPQHYHRINRFDFFCENRLICAAAGRLCYGRDKVGSAGPWNWENCFYGWPSFTVSCVSAAAGAFHPACCSFRNKSHL